MTSDASATSKTIRPDGIDRRADKITARPNDRLVRSALVVLGLVWWCNQGLAFMHQAQGMMLYIFLPVLITIAALGIFFLVWLAFGADVFVTSDGVLRHERRIGPARVWPAIAYPLAAIKDFRAEERVYRIKGNRSLRFEVVFDDASGRRCLVWRRTRVESDDLVRRLHDAMDGEGGPKLVDGGGVVATSAETR